MKFTTTGAALSGALSEIRKAVPQCDRLTFSANGHLEIIGSSLLKSGKVKRVTIEGDSYFGIGDGVAAIESFDTLDKLFRDADLRKCLVNFSIDGSGDKPRLAASIHEDVATGKRKGPDTHSVAAEYKFKTIEPLNDAALLETSADSKEIEAEPTAPVEREFVRSVTLPVNLLKKMLWPGRHSWVRIISNSRGVFVRNDRYYIGVGHDTNSPLSFEPQADRFWCDIPVEELREVTRGKAKQVQIGIVGEAPAQWHKTKAESVHYQPFAEEHEFMLWNEDRQRYDWVPFAQLPIEEQREKEQEHKKKFRDSKPVTLQFYGAQKIVRARGSGLSLAPVSTGHTAN